MSIQRRKNAILFSIAWFFGRRYLRRRLGRSGVHRGRKLLVALGLGGLLASLGWVALRLRRTEPASATATSDDQESGPEGETEPDPEALQESEPEAPAEPE